MEDQRGGETDGSSIKPVSSLRSHFEQMGKSTSISMNAPTRPVSPKPNIKDIRTEAGNVLDGNGISLRPHTRLTANSFPSSTGLERQSQISTRPISFMQQSPAVTVEPPGSPPSNSNDNLTIALPSALLTADVPRTSSTPGSPSPRHFRTPSRSNTPLLELRRSPSLPRPQPPEPPPPRRSGEMRRDPQRLSMGPPPAVNRAEKPRIPAKQASLSRDTESTPLAVLGGADSTLTRPSPFNTPPSNSSSPEPENLHAPPIRTRPLSVQTAPKSQIFSTTFDPPPIHHAVVTMRKDHESIGLGRSVQSSQVTGGTLEQRPALPARPTKLTNLTLRSSSDVIRPFLDSSRSSKNNTPSIRTQEASTTFAAPPRRILSTPMSQVQTPPRTHGRSMTIDQTSDRTAAEFGTPVESLGASVAIRELPPSPHSAAISNGLTPNNPAEYPDPSQSNRRPPFLKSGVREVATKYDTRLFDICGEFVCTSGIYTRVWSLISGEQVMVIAHSEAIRMVSVAFKAAKDLANEGSSLWLGNNMGELVEVDIASQKVVASTMTAHARREVIKIYRHGKEMWTLDDGGALLLWTAHTGSVSLTQQYQPFRVPRGHTFSLVVGNKLWYATGKELRIFEPSSDGMTQFQTLSRPLLQHVAGDITAGTLLGTQSDRVFFGHNDGKVSMYSRDDYSCLGVVNVSIYKLNCMAGFDQYLWTGFNSGTIHVYDTSQTPWVLKKDWRAHQNPVINILVDRSSFWQLGYQQVVSLGADNFVRPWDGLLEDDWLETEIQARDQTFCKFENISTLVMTWNAGASTPHSLRQTDQDASFFRKLLQSSGSPDILVVGFQELVDLEDKTATARSFFKSKKKDSSEPEHMSHQYRDWRDYLIRSLDDYSPKDEMYHLLHTASLVGLFTCIFVKAHLRNRVTDLSAAEVKRGMGGRHGNKGALIVRFRLDDTSMCFVNCHLAAGQSQTKDRNYDISAILESTLLPVERDSTVRLNSYIGGGDGTMILDHEICVLNGDLNYRIDTMGRDAIVNAVKAGNLSKLLERDQLLVSRRKNAAFRLRAFHEMPIRFDPTYKYDVGTDNYDSSEKKRAPAWCDRILYRGHNQLERLKQLDYRRHEVRVSDHRPVTALFQMTIKSVSLKRRIIVWDECLHKFEEIKQNRAEVAKLDYLENICKPNINLSKELEPV